MHLEMPYMRPGKCPKHKPYCQFQTEEAPLSKLSYMILYMAVLKALCHIKAIAESVILSLWTSLA
jgi:hypothetical protein